MNASEHLTKTQISAFSAGSLGASESRSVGGHLIRCVECRGLLPLPDPGKFWAAVMGEDGLQESQASDKSVYSIPPYIHAIGGFFTKPSGLAWSGGALVVILGLALVLLFSASDEPRVESEVAKSFEIETPVSTPSHGQAIEPNLLVRDQTEESDYKDQRPDRALTDQRLPGPRPKQNPKMSRHISESTARPINGNMSSTRGAGSKCGTGRSFEMELGYVETDVVLRWQSVPNAAKYQLYVSDDDEILVDEFESERGTSYVLKKPLDPSKTYKWKIVITLENGQTFYADAQKFSARDAVESYQKVHKSKARSNTRCLVSK